MMSHSERIAALRRIAAAGTWPKCPTCDMPEASHAVCPSKAAVVALSTPFQKPGSRVWWVQVACVCGREEVTTTQNLRDHNATCMHAGRRGERRRRIA